MRRRGERLRFRRRVTLSAVGALALLLPGLALVTVVVRGGADRELRVAASGLAGSMGLPATPETTTTTVGAPAPEAVPPPEPAPSTTAEVHRRVAVVGGSPVPPGVLPADDPVVRAAPPPSAIGRAAPSASTTTVPADLGPVSPCPPSEVSVTVVVERSSYGPGEPVKGSTSVRNNSSKTCLLAPRELVHIEDDEGRTVSNFAATMEFREPVVAAPGRTLTAPFTWDQRDCSGSTCAQAPAGAYTAVARWPLVGPTPSQSATYGPGRASFRIDA